jgi:hypothetical protein
VERKFSFTYFQIVNIYLMTVARNWPAPSSTLHPVLVATLTVRRSPLMVVILLSILKESRNICIAELEWYIRRYFFFNTMDPLSRFSAIEFQ